jgi:protein-disulfide isomerase
MTQVQEVGLTATPRWRIILDVATTLAMLGAAITIVSSRIVRAPSAPKFTIPSTAVSLEGAAVIGNPRATVGILEFSDFECPFCERFARESMPGVKAKLIDTGQVLFAFRNLPLPMHSGARRKAESAVCALEQGRFWQAHDALFQMNKSDSSLNPLGALELETGRFQTCISDRAPAIVDRDVAQANTLSIAGTPFFLLGLLQRDGKLLVKETLRGASTPGEFETAVKKVTLGAKGASSN